MLRHYYLGILQRWFVRRLRVCFDSFIDDWKITDKKQELRPLLGLQTGIRIKRFHVVINPQIFLKTDFENTYYGIEITLGGEQ
jgi:hypothetical protein